MTTQTKKTTTQTKKTTTQTKKTKKRTAPSALSLSQETTDRLTALGIPEIPGMTEDQAAAMIAAVDAAAAKAAADARDKNKDKTSKARSPRDAFLARADKKLANTVLEVLFDPDAAVDKKHENVKRQTLRTLAVMAKYVDDWEELKARMLLVDFPTK
jgi:hypothetical protein